VLVTRLADPRLHELSGSASAIWAELAEPHTLPDLIGGIAGSHGVEVTEVEASVCECLDALLDLGVVRAEGGPDG
jgi:hypothetical protein